MCMCVCVSRCLNTSMYVYIVNIVARAMLEQIFHSMYDTHNNEGDSPQLTITNAFSVVVFGETICTQHILLQKRYSTRCSNTCRNTNFFRIYLYTLMPKRYGVWAYNQHQNGKISEKCWYCFLTTYNRTNFMLDFIYPEKKGKERKAKESKGKRNGTKVIVYEFHIQWPWHCRTWQQHFLLMFVCVCLLFFVVP